MKLQQPGGPQALTLSEVPIPVPEADEALVRVAACGFCHHDLLVMRGLLRRGVKPGLIPGHEISGTVTQVGGNVTTLTPGDRVVSLLVSACGHCDRCLEGRQHRCRNGLGIGHGRDGGFAEYVTASEFGLVKLPDDADLLSAAMFACPMGVALQGLRQSAQVQPGETVVVTGAGGGLGTHSVQLASALGCRVLAVTSSPEKTEALTALGAADVLQTSGSHSDDLDFSEIVLALTEDQGAQVVIDTVGSAVYPSTWLSLAQFGRWVLLGEIAGNPVRIDPAEVIFRDARILGSSGVSRDGVLQVAGMVSQGLVKAVVGRTLAMEEASTAYGLMADRIIVGRILLIPPGSSIPVPD
ncbi:MAG: hypothetical protein BZY75_00465 [SAR202 cluster bacterium Io17-Chloro-G7]|nr:MAG: hypothetical protein BZY75_00465 [SAR202 cluster bacterium Io17-Chloro-G7]